MKSSKERLEVAIQEIQRQNSGFSKTKTLFSVIQILSDSLGIQLLMLFKELLKLEL